MESATRHGLKLLPIIGFTPKWASDSGDLWAYPYSQPFETFFAAALRRYPQIQAWELWNEPNFERFSFGGPDAAGFVELLRAARHARDGAGSTAKLISGGIAPGGEIDMVSWINQIAIRGGLNLIDGLGVHPYSPANPDDPQLLDDAAAGAPRSARRPGQARPAALADRVRGTHDAGAQRIRAAAHRAAAG